MGCGPLARRTARAHSTLRLWFCIFKCQNCAKIKLTRIAFETQIPTYGSCKSCQGQSRQHQCNSARTQSLPRSVGVLSHQPGCLQASGCLPSWSRLRLHWVENLRAPSRLTCFGTVFLWPYTSRWRATLTALQNWLCCWLWVFSFRPLGCRHELQRVKSTICRVEHRCKIPRLRTSVQIQLRL